MKTLNEYLTESKKTYPFKIKIAGDLPEGFEKKFKDSLEKYSVSSFAKTATTPIQESPMDFPTKSNMSVSIFEIALDYPVTSPQIYSLLHADLNISEDNVRVRGLYEDDGQPVDLEKNEKDKKALLDSPYEKGVKAKDYFGDAFNKSFLKDLEKASKQRKKDLGQKDIKSEAKDAGPDYGQSAKSPVGSTQNKLPKAG